MGGAEGAEEAGTAEGAGASGAEVSQGVAVGGRIVKYRPARREQKARGDGSSRPAVSFPIQISFPSSFHRPLPALGPAVGESVQRLISFPRFLGVVSPATSSCHLPVASPAPQRAPAQGPSSFFVQLLSSSAPLALWLPLPSPPGRPPARFSPHIFRTARPYVFDRWRLRRSMRKAGRSPGNRPAGLCGARREQRPCGEWVRQGARLSRSPRPTRAPARRPPLARSGSPPPPGSHAPRSLLAPTSTTRRPSAPASARASCPSRTPLHLLSLRDPPECARPDRRLCEGSISPTPPRAHGEQRWGSASPWRTPSFAHLRP